MDVRVYVRQGQREISRAKVFLTITLTSSGLPQGKLVHIFKKTNLKTDGPAGLRGEDPPSLTGDQGLPRERP